MMDLPLFELASRRSCLVGESEPYQRQKIRNEEGKRAEMLQRLSLAPLTTFDAERLVHRGQATIGSLRQDGHVIDLEKIDGVDCYVYRGKRTLIKVEPSLQELYYQTRHWHSVSAQRREKDSFTCQQCGSGEDLNVHHWRYRLFEESVLHDLMTLCRDCHRSVHEAVKGSQLHFPRTITEELAERIRRGE